MNLAKCQAQNKEDIRQLEDHISKLDNNLRQTQARGTALEQEIARKEDQIKRYEAEIKSLRTDIANKSEEVSFIDYVIEWWLIYYRTYTYCLIKIILSVARCQLSKSKNKRRNMFMYN